MIQKKRFSKWLMLAGVMSIALSVFFCPVASLSAQAAAPGEATVQPRKDDIRYRFTIIDNKIYKRLFNYSTNEWIGDWIYVCDVEG